MNRFGEQWRKGVTGARTMAGGLIVALGIFLVGFLIGLHLFFPIGTVTGWLAGEINARTPVAIEFRELTLRPLFTLVDRNAVVTFDHRNQPPVVLDEFRLKPLWTSLLTGDPGVTIKAALLQGTLDAALRRSGTVDLQAAGIVLSDLPIHPESGTAFSGTVISANLQGSFPAKKGSDSRLAVTLDNCSLTLLGQPLPLGKIVLEGAGPANNLRITTLTASGGALAATGTGTLLLGTSAAASRISLDLTLRPAPSAPADLGTLLDLSGKRQADGSYRLTLSGAPNRLTVN